MSIFALFAQLFGLIARLFGASEATTVDDEIFEGKEDRDWTKAVAAFRQERTRDGSLVTLVGECPNCEHDMSVVLAIRARTGERVNATRNNQPVGRNGSKRFVKVAYCNCDGYHDHRPEAVESGCGRFGALLIGETPKPHGKTSAAAHLDQGGKKACVLAPYVSVRPSAREAAVSDVEWERRADKQAGQVLADARSAAEKWTAAVATLTGLFSVALVVKGPEDVTKVSGEIADLTPISWWLTLIVALVAALAGGTVYGRNRIPRVVPYALFGIAVAFGLGALAGWVEDWSIFEAILVLLGLAVALGATAIIAGTFAAYGLPERFAAATGNILRERQDAQARQARLLLRVLLVSTTLALIAIAGAIALTWVNTADAPASKLLVLTDDGRVCGEIVSKEPPVTTPSADVLVVLQDGDNPPVSVQRESVRALAAVTKC